MIVKYASTQNSLSTGTFQRGIGQHFLTCKSRSAMSECINEILPLIELMLCPKWVSFPKILHERHAIKATFFDKYISNCIDYTNFEMIFRGLANMFRR